MVYIDVWYRYDRYIWVPLTLTLMNGSFASLQSKTLALIIFNIIRRWHPPSQSIACINLKTPLASITLSHTQLIIRHRWTCEAWRRWRTTRPSTWWQAWRATCSWRCEASDVDDSRVCRRRVGCSQARDDAAKRCRRAAEGLQLEQDGVDAAAQYHAAARDWIDDMYGICVCEL